MLMDRVAKLLLFWDFWGTLLLSFLWSIMLVLFIHSRIGMTVTFMTHIVEARLMKLVMPCLFLCRFLITIKLPSFGWL